MSHRSTIARFLLASSLALGLGSSVLAQPRGSTGPVPPHLLRELQLSESQEEQVFKIFHDQAPAIRSHMKAARRAREELQKLAAAGPAFDRDRARALAEAEGKAIAEVSLMRAESMSLVHEILSPEQRAKLDKLRERRPRPEPR